MRLLVKITDNVESIEDLLYAMHQGHNIPVSDVDKYDKVESLSKTNTAEFIKIASDSNLKIVGTIEKYIAYGLLTRVSGSQVIYYPKLSETKPIGNNMEEVIAYFTNTANSSVINNINVSFKNQPKL